MKDVGDENDEQRLRREQEERERNRRTVMERKRQWEVVDSDDDTEGGGGDGGTGTRTRDKKASSSRRGGSRDRDGSPSRGDRSRSRSFSRDGGERDRDDDRRRRRRHRKHSGKRKHKHRRERSSDEDSRSRSRSPSRERSGHKKDRKKHHRRRRSDKDKKKRRKREKESKKHKRNRRESHSGGGESDSYSSSSLSDNEREVLKRGKTNEDSAAVPTGLSGAATFGKYGIVKDSDFHANTKVRRSFEQWLAEVRGVPSFNGPKYELMSYFADFVEDFNTATLPHIKYYDYDKWEMEEYTRQKEAALAKAGGNDANNLALDEMRHREDMAKRAKDKRNAELLLTRQCMTSDKIDEMKNQARMRHEMAVAYKMGDEEKRKKLQKRLEPEELVKR